MVRHTRVNFRVLGQFCNSKRQRSWFLLLRVHLFNKRDLAIVRLLDPSLEPVLAFVPFPSNLSLSLLSSPVILFSLILRHRCVDMFTFDLNNDPLYRQKLGNFDY